MKAIFANEDTKARLEAYLEAAGWESDWVAYEGSYIVIDDHAVMIWTAEELNERFIITKISGPYDFFDVEWNDDTTYVVVTNSGITPNRMTYRDREEALKQWNLVNFDPWAGAIRLERVTILARRGSGN